jgi:threonine dehydrogenase-like Zn-dependent dehydrogenase
MKCAIFYGKNNIVIEEHPVPEIRDDEVLIEVKACGICGTDVGMYNGRIKYKEEAVGRIFGHEVTGVVKDKGVDIFDYQIGDRVVLMPTISCGRCIDCKTGNDNLCHGIIGVGHDIDGGYAKYIKVQESYLHRLPNMVQFEEGTLLADCVPTAVHAINKFANIKAGSDVAVWGTGGQGYTALQISKLNGANVIIVGRRNEKLELAKQLGADHVINSEHENVEKRVNDITNNRGVDISIETGGYPLAISQSIAAACSGGKVIIVGLQKEHLLDTEDIVWKEKSIIGSFWTTEADFIEGIELVNDKKLTLKPLITHKFRLDQIGEAFDLLDARKEYVIKVVIMP